MRIKLKRLVKVWVEDVYEIEQLDKETKEWMFNYRLEPKSTETLWETQVDAGPYEITIEGGSFYE